MRDTDIDWATIGDGEPYYGVLTHERFLRKNLNSESLKEFWQSGADYIDRLHGLVVERFGNFNPINALDFGCGLGRLTRGMAKHSQLSTGIDVSESMLSEARILAPGNTRFVNSIPTESFDWINSFIVFQHIPPERGTELFAALLERLSPGGVVSVQFTFFKSHQGTIEHGISGIDLSSWDGKTLKTLVPNVMPAGAMMMYDYDMNLILALLFKCGVENIYIEHTNHGGCHGALILGRKNR